MEVKDINSQNSVLAMFRKMTGTSGNFEFANLLGEQEQGVISSSSAPVVPSMDKKMPETNALTEKNPVRRDDKNVSDKAENKPVKEHKRKDKKVAEDNTAPVAQDRNEPIKHNVDEPQTETQVVAGENIAQSAPVSTADSAPENVVAPIASDGVVAPVINASVLENISTLGEINYFDALSGTTIKTTGAELVQAISQNQISEFNPANITTPEGEILFPQLVENTLPAQQSSQEGIDISMLDSVEPEEMPELSELVAKKTINTTSTTSETDNMVANSEVEAEEVSPELENEIVIDDKKVKLNVKVTNGEEKISYSTRQEMFADNVAISEAVTKSVNSENKTDNSPITMTSQNSPISTSQTANILPQGVAIQAGVENITSVTSGAAVSSVENISNLTSASLNNGLAAQTKTAAPAAELKSPAEDALKGMSREVVEQVKVNITKSAVKGVDKIDISLKPEDLGQIEIRMQLSKDGKLQAHIISSRPETMEILQKDMQSLQKAFADAGFLTDENSLSFSFNDNSQAWQQQREEENGLRRFMGKIFESEGNNDNLAQAENVWDGKSALNIRV